MRNCLILGCGRSGTSMLAGSLADAGYYMGGNLYRARKANPKGFFESLQINAINERLLKPLTPSRSTQWFLRIWRAWFPSERWLAEVPVGTPIHAPSPRLVRRIRSQLERRPFAFKDPRFCYTLPAWRPYLPRDTAFLCIFREPGRTATSILKECATLYPDIRLSEDEVYAIWLAMYGHILNHHRHQGDWLFMHYDQMLDGSAQPRIEALLGTHIDRHFADTGLQHAASRPTPAHTRDTYHVLCSLAHYPV
ncbi:MAG: hypothetical protein ACRETC_07425 [Gammaproteobacteria bacterium]